MEYTTLGKTGLRVSRMGFGGIPIQKVDAAVTRKLMERLVERGVNYIDTARGYTVSESFLGEALMQKCREQNVGFICMKPMAGGALEDARLAMRFIGRNENVSVVIPGMYDVREIDQNLEAMEDVSPLTEAEKAKLDAIRKELGTQFCRRCNYCQPCTVGIAISGIFVLEGYLNRYGLGDWAKQRYAAMGKKAGDCVGCGACEKRCPYQLPIRQMLARCKDEFGA